MSTLLSAPLKTFARALRVLVIDARFRRALNLFLLLTLAFQLTAPALLAATDVPACGFAEIRGVVTAKDTGVPLPDVSISASGEESFGSGTTDETGAYTVTVPYYLDQGPYRISTIPLFTAELPTVAYLPSTPTTTQVISGATTMLDISLERGGAIQGQVRAADTDNPLEGVFILAHRQLESGFGIEDTSFTDADGNYTFYGLEEGNYVLEFDTLNIGSTDETEQYETVHSGRVNYLSGATQYSVTNGITTTVNISLNLGSAIVGEIRRSDTNDVVAAVSVHAYLLDEDGEGRGELISASSGSDFGTYYIAPLAPGKYLLFAQPYRTNGSGGSQYHNTWDLEEEWYRDVYSSDEAQVVEIPAIGASQQISVDFMLSPGATITGVVTDADSGEPIVDIGVTEFPDLMWRAGINFTYNRSSSLVTDENGVYEIKGVPDGTYTLRVFPDFDSEYAIRGVIPEPVTVTVAGTGVYPNVNLTARRGGSIEGTLMDDQGEPVPNIDVTLVHASNSSYLDAVTSDADGKYRFDKIAPGEYRVRYDRFDPCGCYNNEYYTGEGDDNGVIVVQPNGTVSGINASMACNVPPPNNELFLPRTLR